MYYLAAMSIKKRVLVVEDDSGILRFVKVALTTAGFDVITATSGEAAMNLVETEKPDIMLLDIFMSPMTGLEVLDKLRPTSQIPVIAFSARGSVVDEALKRGANDFIAKPFKPDDLIEKIHSILNRKGAS